jgi:hypothetical protein
MNPTPSTSPAVLPAARIPMRSPLLERLTFLALLIGLVTAASYALGTTTALRIFKPATGAWLEVHQFYLMEGSATALGLIIGIRVGRRLAVDSMGERYGANFVMILAALAWAPLVHVCAAAARLGWSGRGGSLSSWLVDREGYEAAGRFLRLSITAIYFCKTAGLAALAGLALLAIGIARAHWRDTAPNDTLPTS